MRLYCPICFSVLSTSEVMEQQNLVICEECKQQSQLITAKNFSLQLADIQKNRYKKQGNIALWAQYPPLPPKSRLKIKESQAEGEKMLEVQHKQVWWRIFLLVPFFVGLGVFFFFFPVKMLYQDFWGGSMMWITLFIILFLVFQFIQYLLAVFIPEKICVIRGKLIYTSVWGKESSYFEEEIANIFPDIVVTKNKNGETRTPVLTLALEGESKENIFERLPENEALWLSGLLKKYLQETGIGQK
ncbi:MAG: hypothetical protein ACKVTZ_20990 [Bacteroidia bacterium]